MGDAWFVCDTVCNLNSVLRSRAHMAQSDIYCGFSCGTRTPSIDRNADDTVLVATHTDIHAEVGGKVVVVTAGRIASESGFIPRSVDAPLLTGRKGFWLLNSAGCL
jgi:hypothetical protein